MSARTHWMAPLALLTLIAGGPAARSMDVAPPPATVSFGIRADFSQSDAISALLAEIGEPVLYPIAQGSDPREALADICGVKAPRILELVSVPTKAGTGTYARAAPCVRRLKNVIAIARDGDTLESIAVRLGMRPSSSGLLRVHKSKSPLRKAMQARLSKGDQVLAAFAPDWSTFTPRPGTLTTRDELVKAIAGAMKCGAEVAETCLSRRSVFVTERNRLKAAASSGLQSRADDQPPAGPAPSGPAASGPAPATADTPVPVAPGAVASGQWPYDAELVKLLLKEAVDAQGLLPTVIGVADNGLATRDGKPLPPELFASTYEPVPGDDKDDDLNSVVDDLIGAGAPRDDLDTIRTGDLALCDAPQMPDYANWPGPGREAASHGAVVSSIATGYGLRSSSTAAALPQLLFYRTVRNSCSADTDVRISEQDIIDAAEYLLFYDINVLNMSFAQDQNSSVSLANRLVDVLVAPNAPILVAAAGNSTGDIDVNRVCPACLGNGERYTQVPRQRIVVVGTADSTLRRADYSGFGDKTVRLYAPGEPVGAIDIDGADASAFQSATSYGTPLVSLAIGIIHAMGVADQAKIRNRLYLSTWPLLGDDDKPVGNRGGPLGIGVLDLVRVAAIRHQAIEALQTQADGRVVRRTYVGKITAGMDGICPGVAIDQPAFQGIRLEPADASGMRDATLIKRALDRQTYYPDTQSASCLSSGDVTIAALRDGTVTIPAATVTQILLPMKPR